MTSTTGAVPPFWTQPQDLSSRPRRQRRAPGCRRGAAAGLCDSGGLRPANQYGEKWLPRVLGAGGAEGDLGGGQAAGHQGSAQGDGLVHAVEGDNKAGGITTLEDKSCGCVQKGGTAPVVDVINYGGQVATPGLNLLSGPGNDLVSATALTAAGAHLILFTTGRGTPMIPMLEIVWLTAFIKNPP